jgi:hypothetical protein
VESEKWKVESEKWKVESAKMGSFEGDGLRWRTAYLPDSVQRVISRGVVLAREARPGRQWKVESEEVESEEVKSPRKGEA